MTQYGHRLALPPNAQFLRRQSEVFGTLLGFKTCRQLDVKLTAFEFNGLEHLWLTGSKAPKPTTVTTSRRRFVLLYFHGGGYGVLSPRMYISAGAELQTRIASHLQAIEPNADVQVDVLLANYRKTPEHRYPAGPEDAFRMYEYLLQHEQLRPQQIIVAGDSAGGGLTVTTLLRARDAEARVALPLAGLLVCPYVDLENPGEDHKAPYCILGKRACVASFDAYHARDGPPSTWG
ncbi:hypothetical protein PINS_up016766 [Pythium insidiosum]|nr:hypothetical protein PINS_up016766 [Pythium insidiosum]